MASTINSTIKGKAYEYACLVAFYYNLGKNQCVKIVQNTSYNIAKQYYLSLENTEQDNMLKSATAGAKEIISLEPMMTKHDNDEITLELQPDNVAKDKGDIRDLLIIRSKSHWEIGVSIKHNHAALKHSRLSAHLDFGKEWFGKSCSQEYFKSIEKIFLLLQLAKSKGLKWSDIPDKADNVYVPILKAFRKEFLELSNKYDITKRMASYLIGSNGKDYYKLIHHNNHKVTIVPYNIKGQLNQNVDKQNVIKKIPKIKLPTHVLALEFKKSAKTTSKNTLLLSMDNGWSISFRIHNASTHVEPSLKFNIQLIGQPADMDYIDVAW